jgi:hypothetical protein
VKLVLLNTGIPRINASTMALYVDSGHVSSQSSAPLQDLERFYAILGVYVLNLPNFDISAYLYRRADSWAVSVQ